ncbi:hypothetical protein SERLA73DRAFT_44664, partial [Serpula lacrymans var. lacrymans S7.3]
WPSVYSGIQVIVNRETPSHSDKGGCPSSLDTLVSLGTNQNAILQLDNLKAELEYRPETMIGIMGRVLRHTVPASSWGSGERICIA